MKSVFSSLFQGVTPKNLSFEDGEGTSLARLLGLLRAKGGQLYMAGPANNEFISRSAAAPDGIGTDPIGYARNLAADELGSELLSNAELATDLSGWTNSYLATPTWQAPGEMLVTITGATNGNQGQPLPPLKTGALYRVTGRVRNLSCTSAIISVQRTSAGSFAFIAGSTGAAAGVSAVLSFDFVAPAADAIFNISCVTTAVGQQAVLEWASVREVRAAYQTTTAAKPKLVREPILGPELVANGGFDSSANWSLSQPASGAVTTSGGSLTINSADGSYCAANQTTLFATPGKTYLLSVVATANSGAGARIDWGGVTGALYVGANSTGMKTAVFTATGASPTFTAARQGVTNTVLDNISAREILGYRDVWSWEFDGVDDRLQFVPPSAGLTDNICLCLAVTPLRAIGASAERYLQIVAGSAQLRIAHTTSSPGRFEFVSYDGTGLRDNYAAPLFTIGRTYVLTLWNTVAGMTCRIDGAQVGAQNVTVQSNPALGTGSAALGSSGNTTANLANARVQAPVIAQGITTLAEVQQIEREVARLAGVALQ